MPRATYHSWKSDAEKKKIIDDLVLAVRTVGFDKAVEESGFTKNQIHRLLYVDTYGAEYYKEAKNCKRLVKDTDLKERSAYKKRKAKKKKSRKSKYTTDFRQTVAEGVLETGNVYNTAKKFHVCTFSVYKWLKEFFPDKYYYFVSKKTDKDLSTNIEFMEKVIEEKETGIASKELAKKYGINEASLNSAIAFHKKLSKKFDEGISYGIEEERRRMKKKFEKIKKDPDLDENLILACRVIENKLFKD